MKTIRLFVAFLAVTVMAGCATPGHEDTVTGTVVGGLIGGAVGGNKGAVTGGLLGAGIGVLSDAQNRKDNERAEKIGNLIYNKTGGGNDSEASQSASTAEANIAFAEKQRRKCEAKYGTYKNNGVRKPHNCQVAFDQALTDAELVSEANSPEVFHAIMRGGYGQYDGIRPGSRHARYWQRSRMNPYYGTRW